MHHSLKKHLTTSPIFLSGPLPGETRWGRQRAFDEGHQISTTLLPHYLGVCREKRLLRSHSHRGFSPV